jgi:hypothetical protein
MPPRRNRAADGTNKIERLDDDGTEFPDGPVSKDATSTIDAGHPF